MNDDIDNILHDIDVVHANMRNAEFEKKVLDTIVLCILVQAFLVIYLWMLRHRYLNNEISGLDILFVLYLSMLNDQVSTHVFLST